MTGLVFLILLTLIAALGLVFVIRIHLNIRAILEALGGGRSLDEDDPIVLDHVHAFGFVGHRVQGVFIVWEWRAERWHYIPQADVTEPGVPPSFSGAFEGDIAKTWMLLTGSSQSSTRSPSP